MFREEYPFLDTRNTLPDLQYFRARGIAQPAKPAVSDEYHVDGVNGSFQSGKDLTEPAGLCKSLSEPAIPFVRDIPD